VDCALRAPTVFPVRIKTIRTENTVMDKNKDGVEVLYKIETPQHGDAI